MHQFPRHRRDRKPATGGCSVLPSMLLVVATIFTSSLAVTEATDAPPMLTEVEAVERGLALPAYADTLQRDVSMARARAREERLWPNPVLSYSREVAGGSTEDMVWLWQEFAVSGSRGLRAAAADELLSAAEQSVERRRDLRAARIRVEFYSVLLGQNRTEVAEKWALQLTEAVQAVARREAAGDVSSYDRRRVERELHNAESRVASEKAALETAWMRFAPLFGIEPVAEADWPMVVGTLLPATEPPSIDGLVVTMDARADLMALENEVHAAELRSSAAARGWIPPVTLGAGPKIVDTAGVRDTGFLVTAFVPIPVFQREQADRIRADAEARYARGQLSLRRAESLARLRGAWRNAVRVSEAARRLAAKTGDASVQLVHSAEAGYRGGEIGVLELLDAYRAMLEDGLRRLELEVEARRARIELDVTIGGGSRP